MSLNRQFIVLILAVVLTLFSVVSGEAPQLVNYQGRLVDSGGDPVTTTTSVVFTIWNDSVSGDSLWSESRSITPDANGVFSVLLGSVSPVPDSAFVTSETYLGIQVDGDPEINPRQRLASVPYAISTAQWTLSGKVLYTGGIWGIARAGNTLTGTYDSTQVNLGVDCETSHQYATVGGGHKNTASGWNSTIGGGSYNTASGTNVATVAGGNYNSASGNQSAVGGGIQNDASGYSSTIGGGAGNEAGGNESTVGGGFGNHAGGYSSTIAGGYFNRASDTASTVGGGYKDTVDGLYATVPGGLTNRAGGYSSFAAGHNAKALHGGAFVWADSTDADFSSTGANQFLIRSGNGVGINVNNPTTDLDIAGQIRIRGGSPGDNKVLTSSADGTATWETATGGVGGYWSVTDSVLHTNGYWGIVRGGAGNYNYGDSGHTMVNLGVACTTGVAGGWDYHNTIGGGYANKASGRYAAVAGGNLNTASNQWSSIGGGFHNIASGGYSRIGGGLANLATGDVATVGGGQGDTASGDYSTAGGGLRNVASNINATVGGGAYNAASGLHATVSGGQYNEASGSSATVGGGELNVATGIGATVIGGVRDTASGDNSTAAGGYGCLASGQFSFAAGYSAKATHRSSFVWADLGSEDFNSVAADAFHVRASGGVYLYTSDNLTSGAYLSSGGSSWTAVSDSTLKRNIREVDYSQVLAKVAALPVSQWSYKSQDESIEHIGPMAQDFYRLFALGHDDKHINTIDPDGVALAAVRGLYEVNQELKDRLRAQAAEISTLKSQLSGLTELVEDLLAKQKDRNDQFGLIVCDE